MANLNNALKKLCSDANVIKETYYGSSHRASFTLNGEKSEWDIFHIGIPFSPQKEAELMRRFGLERDDLASFYGNFEKVGPLGTKLPRNDTQITTQAGDIILYQGNQITIYYDTNSWNFTRLGKVDGVTQAELKKILGKSDVTAVFSVME